MVRTQGPSSDDPFYRRGAADRNSFVDDALPLDAGLTDGDEAEESQQFRRAPRRVPVRRGAVGRKTASRLRTALIWALVVGVLGAGLYATHRFATTSWRFRVRSANDIEVAGTAPNSRTAVMDRMRDVVGRDVFAISLPDRKQELEKIPWVESATVMRLWPNHLRVVIKERTPVAFVDIGGRVALIDAQGVVMEMTAGTAADYAFPVIMGMTESDPLSTRAARMKIFGRLIGELDGSDGAHGKLQYSRNLEEVDLSDPEDVKVTVKGPSGPILLHLGDENFLPRFMVYLSNVQKWEQERGKLQSVDLRYGREVILNPDLNAPPPASASAAPPPPAAAQQAAPPAAPVYHAAKHAKEKHSRRRGKRK